MSRGLLVLVLLGLYVASLLGDEAVVIYAMALVGLLVIGIPATLAHRSDDLHLGVDGLRTPREFFPWESIERVELEGECIVIHGHDGYRGWVAPRLPGRAYHQILDKLDELERGALRAGQFTDVGQGYRGEGPRPPEVLVRIAQDPTMEEDRRIDAFVHLDDAHRDEVLESIADADFRKQLESLD